MNLLVFAGTTEGTAFVRLALVHHHAVTASVATDYGADVLKKHLAEADLPTAQADSSAADASTPATLPHNLRILHSRLSAAEIATLVANFSAVVDATHPYAAEVTQNIVSACAQSSVPYFRLLRQTVLPKLADSPTFHECATMPELVSALSHTSGNIFVSTGSRDLAAFTALPDYKNRLFVRVLPSAESIELCRAAGFDQTHIIAMQGAFSVELNKSLFAEYNCRILVTKESGDAGGFAQKIQAAHALGMEVYALKPPREPSIPKDRIFSSPDALLSALVADTSVVEPVETTGETI